MTADNMLDRVARALKPSYSPLMHVRWHKMIDAALKGEG